MRPAALQVFSIAKNRVKRLPVYLTQMPYLKVLKLDHNPLDWPPKEITTFPLLNSPTSRRTGSTESERARRGTPATKVEDAEDMQRWLPHLIKWIKDNGGTSRLSPLAVLSLTDFCCPSDR